MGTFFLNNIGANLKGKKLLYEIYQEYRRDFPRSTKLTKNESNKDLWQAKE